jgi:hypothetical protein
VLRPLSIEALSLNLSELRARPSLALMAAIWPWNERRRSFIDGDLLALDILFSSETTLLLAMGLAWEHREKEEEWGRMKEQTILGMTLR